MVPVSPSKMEGRSRCMSGRLPLHVEAEDRRGLAREVPARSVAAVPIGRQEAELGVALSFGGELVTLEFVLEDAVRLIDEALSRDVRERVGVPERDVRAVAREGTRLDAVRLEDRERQHSRVPDMDLLGNARNEIRHDSPTTARPQLLRSPT